MDPTLDVSTQFAAGFRSWLLTIGVTGLATLIVCYFALIFRFGPLGAGDRIYSVIVSSLVDLVRLSPRRTLAIAWLAMKESLRKLIVVGLIIFVLVMAFALWFLDTESIDPSTLHVSFMLTAVNYLMLLIAVLASVFSLPNDLKNKTIYTVVTKPVRSSEIVLGRILGFTAVCTLPLLVMSGASYAFVVRALDHTHVLTEADLRPLSSEDTGRYAPGSRQGYASSTNKHRHRAVVDADGNGATEMNDADRIKTDDAADIQDRFGRSHWHAVTGEKRGDGRMLYHIGPPQGQFHARVPIKGRLSFRDKDGNAGAKGYNVGNWTKRDYVAGGTLSAAIFTFDGLREADFPDGLPLEMNIRLFRTTKEGLNKPLLGSLAVRNPLTGLTAAPRNFAAREYYTLEQLIPRTLTDVSGKPLDLFRDLTHNGRVEIELQCIPRSQFFGVGPDDLFVLAREGRFDVNFAKCCFGLWLQMVLTIVIGVFWSTFLGGPVAMLTTAASVIGALLRPFFLDIVRDNLFEGRAKTGGVLESLVRMTDQRSITLELEQGATTTVIQTIDRWLATFVEGLLQFVPDFSSLNDIDAVAAGFDIPAASLGMHALLAVGFIVPLFLAAFVIFKLTEVAK